MTIKLITYKI